MLFFVDTEHASGYEKEVSGPRLLGARTRITYKLEDLLGEDVHLIRYDRLDWGALERLQPRALFFSGSSSEPDDFGPGQQDSMFEVIRESELPMFGFCGGLHVMGSALGVPPTRVGRLPDGVEDPIPQFAPGWIKEAGYFGVELVAEHPVLDGIGPNPIMRHAHSWELAKAPAGFRTIASTDVTAQQLIVNDDRRIVASQFHPEYWTDEHPDGATMITNFARWSGLL